jgi:hypothetical protein
MKPIVLIVSGSLGLVLVAVVALLMLLGHLPYRF